MGRSQRLCFHPAELNLDAAPAPIKSILRALQEDPPCFRTAQQCQTIHPTIQQHHHR